MALNLLGNHDEKDIMQSAPEVEKYIPPDEPKSEKKEPEPIKKPEPEAVPALEVLEPLDLAENLKRKQKIKVVLISVLAFLIIVGVAVGAYFAAVRYGSPFSPETNNVLIPANNTNVITPVTPVPSNTNTNVNAPVVVEPTPTQPSGALPDTPLAPLRGAIVRFPNSNDVYLIEKNGELRIVVPESVTFKNGQTISSLSPNLIYTLPLKWQSTRKGDKIVSGQVDFDPRILTLNELLPFLQ